MVTTLSESSSVSRWRDRTSSVLLVLAAIGAAFSFVGAFAAVSDAGTATRLVEIWRMLGFFVFSGLFLLLAWRPRVYAGVWELVIVNKAALAIAGLTLGSSFGGALTAAAVDGALALVLVAAYVLSKGYLAWGVARRNSGSGSATGASASPLAAVTGGEVLPTDRAA